jgi:tetratricopeptide (TPR) repeat protein
MVRRRVWGGVIIVLVIAAGASVLWPVLDRNSASIMLAKDLLAVGPDRHLAYPLGECGVTPAPAATQVSGVTTAPDARSASASPYLNGLKLLQNERWDEAQQVFTQLNQRAAQPILEQYALGVINWERGAVEAAHTAWQRAGVAWYFITLGQACLVAHNMSGAHQYFVQALEIVDAADLNAYRTLMDYFIYRDDEPNMQRVLAGYLKLNPAPTAEHYLRLARAYLVLKNPAEAENAVNQALQAEPQMADAWFMAGLLAFGQHNYEVARERWQQALRLDPKLLAADMYMGHSYLAQTQLDQAYDWYKRGYDLDQDRDWPLGSMIDVRLRQQRWRDAFELANQLLPITSDRPGALLQAADAASGLRDWTTARRYIEEAVALDSNNLGYNLRLAQVCLQLNEQTCARAAYERVLVNDPNNLSAREGLQKLP